MDDFVTGEDVGASAPAVRPASAVATVAVAMTSVVETPGAALMLAGSTCGWVINLT